MTFYKRDAHVIEIQQSGKKERKIQVYIYRIEKRTLARIDYCVLGIRLCDVSIRV